MNPIKDLYSDLILDHCRNPRNQKKINHCNRNAGSHNPLCGDRLNVYLQIENGIIMDLGFDGIGCAISIASASMMTEILKTKTVDAGKEIRDAFLDLFAKATENESPAESLGVLNSFSSLRQYPVRARCAILAWQALSNALDDDSSPKND